MSSLIFHDLPAGAVPLYIGEPAEGVAETGLIVLDHVGQEVRFVKSDPFGAFEVPAHSTQRYSRWEIDAMMPRWQLHRLYGEARPLLDRIQVGTTMTRLPTHWDRDQTPEAQAASALVDDLTAQPVEAAVDWVPGLRPVREETALERAIRLAAGEPLNAFQMARAMFLARHADKERQGILVDADERHIRNMLAHGTYDIGDTNALPSPVVVGKTWDALQFLNNMGPVSSKLTANSGSAVGSPPQETMRRRTKGVILPGNHDRYSRKGINGKWGALFEESNTQRRVAG
jgi:hypothetical protein